MKFSSGFALLIAHCQSIWSSNPAYFHVKAGPAEEYKTHLEKQLGVWDVSSEALPQVEEQRVRIPRYRNWESKSLTQETEVDAKPTCLLLLLYNLNLYRYFTVCHLDYDFLMEKQGIKISLARGSTGSAIAESKAHMYTLQSS